MTVHSVRMPEGFGTRSIKSRGRPLSVMPHLKRSVVEVKASENCVAHSIIIAMAKLENDHDYKAYVQGRKIRPVVQKLLAKTGLNLSEGRGIPELLKFQEHFRQYKITVYRGLAYEDIIFEGQVDSSKRINLLYDDVEQHYHVIVNITGGVAKKYVCNACKISSASDANQRCEQTCSDCMASPPCVFTAVRIPCAEFNRHFRSQTCFANHKESTSNKKSICERKRCCETCGALTRDLKHDCRKRYC
jgi:hypothetical protein